MNSSLGVRIELFPTDSPGKRISASVDHDGIWTANGLRATGYRVKISGLVPDTPTKVATTWHGGGASFSNAEVVTLAAGEKRTGLVTRVPLAGSISGRLADDAAGIFVSEVMTGPDSWETFGSEGYLAPDSTWAVHGLHPGTYRLRFVANATTFDIASGYVGGGDAPSSAQLFEVGEGETVDIGTYTPRRGGRVSGYVLDSAGEPIGGASVQLKGRKSLYRSTTTKNKGRYVFRGLDTDEYFALVNARNFVPSYSGGVHQPLPESVPDRSYVQVVAGKTVQMPLELRRPSQLRGRVTDAAGLPVEGVSVTLTPPPGTPRAQTVGVLTLADGTYALSGRWAHTGTLSFSDSRGRYRTVFHNGADTEADATPIQLVPEGRVTADATVRPLAVTLDVAAPAVGENVTARIPGVSPKVLERGKWQWYRDGEPLQYGKYDSYNPKAEDVGGRLTARFTVRENAHPYTAHTYDSPPTEPVRPGVTDLRISAVALGKRQVRITATATSPTVHPLLLDAKVVVSIVRPGDDRTRTLTMVDGKATYVLTNQPLGRQTYYADLLAAPGLLPDRSPQVVATVR